MAAEKGLDLQRLSRFLEVVGEHLPARVLAADFPELTSKEIRQLFYDLAEHIRNCPDLGDLAVRAKKPDFGGMAVSLYSDGAARGNPGPAGAGAVLLDEEGEPIAELSRFLGNATNNQAEYRALICGLEVAQKLGMTHIQIFLDSELVVRQLNGQYKVRHQRLQPLYREAMSRLKHFDDYAIVHVGRMYNQQADRLANEAINRGVQGGERELFKMVQRE
jgi:ribonuclease HI